MAWPTFLMVTALAPARPHLLLRQVHQPPRLHVAEVDGPAQVWAERGQPDRGATPGRLRAVADVTEGLPPQPQVGRGGADGGQVRGEQVGGLVLPQPHHGGLHLAGADPAAGAQLRLVADQNLQPHQRRNAGQGNLVDGGVDRVGLRRPAIQVGPAGIRPLPLMRAAQPGAPQRRHPRAHQHPAGAEPRSRRGLGGEIGSRGQVALSRLADARLAQACDLSRPDAPHHAGPLAIDAPLGRRRRGGAPRLDIGGAAGRLPRRAAALAQPRLARRRPLAARMRAVPQDVPRLPRREAQAIGQRVQPIRGQIGPVRLRERGRGRRLGGQRCGHGWPRRCCWWASRSPMNAAASMTRAGATCR